MKAHYSSAAYQQLSREQFLQNLPPAGFPKTQFGVNGAIVWHVLSVYLHEFDFPVKIFAIREKARDNVESRYRSHISDGNRNLI